MRQPADTKKIQVRFKSSETLELKQAAEREHRPLAGQVRHLALKGLEAYKAQ